MIIEDLINWYWGDDFSNYAAVSADKTDSGTV
jgi:hypothetical protein